MWLRYNFSKEKSLSHRFTVTGLPVHQSTSPPVHQSNCKPVDQFTVTSLPVLDSRLTTHDSQLISALGLVEFSIQWFWSIATNPSLELTFKCGFDTIFQKKNHSATGSPLTTDWQQITDNGEHTTHLSPLTTNSGLRPSRVLDTMVLVYRHKPITRTDRNYSPFTNHQNPLHHYTITPLATHLSPLTTKPLHHYTTHDTCHFEPACVPWKAGDFR
jgi:hypothetical protein